MHCMNQGREQCQCDPVPCQCKCQCSVGEFWHFLSNFGSFLLFFSMVTPKTNDSVYLACGSLIKLINKIKNPKSSISIRKITEISKNNLTFLYSLYTENFSVSCQCTPVSCQCQCSVWPKRTRFPTLLKLIWNLPAPEFQLQIYHKVNELIRLL